MKLLFGATKKREVFISRAVREVSQAKRQSNQFAQNQFKELVKKNLSVPVTLYHL